MTLTAFCDSCGKKIRVGREYAGKKVKCLHCGHVLILPKRESFLSDPHADFARRSEGQEEDHDEGELAAGPDSPPDAEHMGLHDDAATAYPGDFGRGVSRDLSGCPAWTRPTENLGSSRWEARLSG